MKIWWTVCQTDSHSVVSSDWTINCISQDSQAALLPRGGLGVAGGRGLPSSQYYRPRSAGLPGCPPPPQPGTLATPGVPQQQHVAGVRLLLRLPAALTCHHLRLQEEIHQTGGGGGRSDDN